MVQLYTTCSTDRKITSILKFPDNEINLSNHQIFVGENETPKLVKFCKSFKIVFMMTEKIMVSVGFTKKLKNKISGCSLIVKFNCVVCPFEENKQFYELSPASRITL